MAAGDVIIRIRADSRDFQADVEKARSQLNRLSGAANQASGGLNSGAGAMGKLTSALKDTAMYSGAFQLLGDLSEIPGKVRAAADSYTDIQSKLKLATSSTNELAVANERLFDMSQKNRVAFADTVQLYSGIAMPLKDAGKSQEEILKFTDLVGKGLQVSGSSASEAASTIKQLSQAMASGVLRGDEFNSIMENGKAVSMALAEGLGTTTGKLREMAEKGKLTSELVFSALMSQSDEMTKKFSQIAPTMEKVWVTVGNTALREIGKIDAATGASASIAKGLESVANNMDGIFTGATASASVLAAVLGGKAVTALGGMAAAQVSAAQASGIAARAAIVAAEADTVSAAATLRKTEARVVDTQMIARQAIATRVATSEDLVAARGTTGYAAALTRLTAARVAETRATTAAAVARAEYTAASAAAIASTNALAASQAAATVTARGFAAASALGSSALALVGGPAGFAMLAGVALYYVADANNEAAKSITLANGQTLNFGETLDYVTEISNEYRDASSARQDAIREEIDNIIKLTEQRKIEAKAQLDYLNSLDAETAKGGEFEGNFFREGLNDIRKGWADIWGLDQGEARAAIKESSDQLDALTKKQKDLGKSAEELSGELKKTPEDYAANARGLLAMGDATKKATTVTVEAGQVLHSHGDTIKSLVESLAQQRIELVNGKDAADYYAKRLQGLTDAEARAAIGANQYNVYLAERKKLTTESASAGAGLRDQYIAHLDEIGLGADAANDGINAAKSATDKMVSASDQYKISIDKATESLKLQAEAAKAVLAAASNPVVPDAAGTIAAGSVMPSTGGKADASLGKKMQLAAMANPSTMAAIKSVSASSGVDPTMMKAMAWIESNFNAKAHNKSSASGVYQFVNSTAKQYGLSGKQFDPMANTQAYVKLLNDNMAGLKRYGIEVNAANLYLAHQQGLGGLKQITNEAKGYGRMDADVRRNMKNNPSGYAKDDSAAEFLRGWREKYAVVEASVRSLGNETAKVAPMFKSGVQGLADEANKVAPLLAKTGATSVLSGLFPVIGTVADAAKATFKGVAVESGKVAKDAGIKGIVAEAGKIAPTAAKSIPIWDELGAKTQKINDIAVEYNGTIDQSRMTEEQRNALIDDYMSGQANALIKSATDHLQQVKMTTLEYRQWQLHQDKFNAGEQQRILNAETSLAYAEEEKNLRQELAAIKNPGLADQYAAGLSDKTLTPDQIRQLTGQKMEIKFSSNMAELNERADKARMTDDAYQRMVMTRDKFTESQINGQMAWEKEVERMEEVRQLGEGLGDVFQNGITGAMQDMLHTGNGILDQLIDKLIESVMTTQAMESVFSNFGNGVTSFLGFAKGGAFASGGVQAYANGGAFHNSVLHQPTQFFANGGLAVAGEAGAEAVMPLTRINGKLGVQAVGGAAVMQPKISIQVVNNGQPVRASTSQSVDQNGDVQIKVLLEAVDAAQARGIRTGNGQTAQAMQDTFGLQRAGY